MQSKRFRAAVAEGSLTKDDDGSRHVANFITSLRTGHADIQLSLRQADHALGQRAKWPADTEHYNRSPANADERRHQKDA
ncbi:hypothetical protein HNQ72_005149 [Rhizobium wenxiniae]|uniref:Uncharacterized protein n=1 Tax=Rhizobium wenxiniae TaxID=1737357 RepID=A0A7W9YCR0_9HYPH|nr:hypothetical protein [Rhizobium wenxiniae]MBB6165303.1 hypothetical protein [Rhizobium wenxiniae]